MTDSSIKEKLYAPLTVDSRRGRGGTYGYVKWQAVADRMNETFGMGWSSNVISQEIMDNVVIVRVSVHATDPITDMQFFQEGFGASELRPSDEAGSAHKGAYSKALKDACKKWGIGLHLEDEATTNAAPTSIPAGYTGYETGQPAPTTPAPAAAGAVTPGMPAPSTPSAPMMPAPIPVASHNAAPAMPSAPVTPAPMMPAPTAEMGLPPTPAPAGINPAAAPVQQAPAVPSVPVMAPPTPATTEVGSSPDTPGTITSVQDMAIQNLARLNGAEGQTTSQFLQGLIDNPECELSRAVTSLNELSYNEAVCVIKAAKSL